jgi:hypothetical protein
MQTVRIRHGVYLYRVMLTDCVQSPCQGTLYGRSSGKCFCLDSFIVRNWFTISLVQKVQQQMLRVVVRHI